MSHTRTASFAFACTVSMSLAGTAFAGGPTPAPAPVDTAPSSVVQISGFYDASANWKLGFRAGWGKEFYHGDVEPSRDRLGA